MKSKKLEFSADWSLFLTFSQVQSNSRRIIQIIGMTHPYDPNLQNQTAINFELDSETLKIVFDQNSFNSPYVSLVRLGEALRFNCSYFGFSSHVHLLRSRSF